MLKLIEGKKYLSLDAETDGLWGNPFAIGLIVYEVAGGRLIKLLEFVEHRSIVSITIEE